MSHIIHVGRTTIPYHIRERARKRILSLNVKPGVVEVVTPKNTPETVVEEFVHAKRRWIYSKFKRFEKLEQPPQEGTLNMPEHFCSGAKIPYRGRMMPLTVHQDSGPHVRIEFRNGFHITLPERLEPWRDAAIRRELMAWLRLRLARDATAFAKRYGKKLHVKARRISVKAQRHFWGYCSKDGAIVINRNLIFAPKQILEYVIAHELCHLKHCTHGEEFWQSLNSVFPEWSRCETWLEKNEQVWDIHPQSNASDMPHSSQGSNPSLG